LEEYLIKKGNRIYGLALCHFADCHIYNSGMALFRPRAFNNKNIMDEYRRRNYPTVNLATSLINISSNMR
jgi:hypothetical protein